MKLQSPMRKNHRRYKLYMVVHGKIPTKPPSIVSYEKEEKTRCRKKWESKLGERKGLALDKDRKIKREKKSKPT